MTTSMDAPSNVRKGTATRRAGRATARKILDAARQLLMREGYAQFSMRNVAEAAGLHLANLQYYFPRRDDLVRAMLSDTGVRYEEAYERLLADTAPDPAARLRIILKYQIEDVFVAETRQFFVQLWALLSTLEDSPGALLSELYEYDIGPLAECIKALDPELSELAANQRARLIAAMIEGLMIVRGRISVGDAKGQSLFDSAYEICLGIATGTSAAGGQ